MQCEYIHHIVVFCSHLSATLNRSTCTCMQCEYIHHVGNTALWLLVAHFQPLRKMQCEHTHGEVNMALYLDIHVTHY